MNLNFCDMMSALNEAGGDCRGTGTLARSGDVWLVSMRCIRE